MTGEVPGEFAFLTWGGITLALRETDQSIAKCMCEISFQVSDVRNVMDSLSKKGVSFTKPLRAVTSNEQGDLLATDFRDPDGFLCQRQQDLRSDREP
jgi:hypothetical protein